MSNNDYQNFKIGSLWLKTSKDGNTKYMQGNIDLYGAKINISVFKNTKKEKDTQPDYYISASVKNQNNNQNNKQNNQNNNSNDYDEVPF